MKNNSVFGMLALMLTLGLVLVGCPTDGDDGGQDALTMSDYLKYVDSERFTDWGEGEVIRYRLKVTYKDEIVAAFYNENSFVVNPQPETRDWETGKTAFEYVEIVTRNSGTFHSRMLRYLESDNQTTIYRAYDKPEIGATFSDNWGEEDGTVNIEYLGQTSPSSTFREENSWGGRLYPGYYKVTATTRYRYLHIIDKDAAEMTDWIE